MSWVLDATVVKNYRVLVRREKTTIRFKTTNGPSEERFSNGVSNCFFLNCIWNSRNADFVIPVPDTSRNWIRNPLETRQSDINLYEKQFKNVILSNDALSEFSVTCTKDYPDLPNKALDILIPFPTSYHCKIAFSILVYVRINKDFNLRLKLSSIESEISELITVSQLLTFFFYRHY